MARVSFDSCFLIDFERERAGKNINGAPAAFLRQNSALQLAISPVALGEFAVGFSNDRHPILVTVMENFELLNSSSELSLVYGRLYRDLASDGALIGGNDLWIASYSLVADLPLVTNNTKDFVRVPGLKILNY